MAEYLLTEFYEFQGECVQKKIMEEMDNIDVMSEVENKENNGEKVCMDHGKRKRAECQSQLGSKKMKNEEEDPEKNTSVDDLPNELLERILKNLETEDVMTAGQTCRRWFSVGRRVWQKKLEEIKFHICLLCHGEKMDKGINLGFDDPDKIRSTKFHYANCLFLQSPKLFYDLYSHRQKENENGDPEDIMGGKFKYPCEEKGCTNRRQEGYKSFVIHQAKDHNGLRKLLADHENPKVRTVVNRLEEIEAYWKMTDYVAASAEVNWASVLAKHGHTLRQVITTKSEEIEASWSNESYTPSPAEVHCASSLAAQGHLPHQVLTNMADKIAKALDYPSLAEVQCGAALATLGYITQLERLWLYDLDISLVPAEDLRSLVTCSAWVTIYRVTGDLSTVLSNVQSRMLDIVNTRLSTADTQQLVAAMETSVMSVVLDSSVTLDMETLAQYDGTGECEEVIMMWDTRKRYRSQVKVWAENMGWRVEEDGLWNSTRLIPL